MNSLPIGATLQKTIELNYLANQPVMLEGTTGVGKSESCEQAAKNLGIDCVTLDLSLLEPVDLVGLPMQTNGKTVYAPPKQLPDKGKGLLVLEELNRAPRYTLAPCLQLLTVRRLNDYVLPKGWLPVAAINPATDSDYQVEQLDKALLARFVKINVTADVKQWLNWAKRNSVHAKVQAFVGKTPAIFDAPQSNPRAWAYVSNLLQTAEQHDFDNTELQVSIAGLVGVELAAAFMSFYREGMSCSVTAADILSAFPTHRKEIEQLVSSGDMGSVQSLVHQLQLHLQEPVNAQVFAEDTQAQQHASEFAACIPSDLRDSLTEAVEAAIEEGALCLA